MDINLIDAALKKQKRWYGRKKIPLVGILQDNKSHRLIPCDLSAFSIAYQMIDSGYSFSHFSGWIPIFKK